MPLIETPVMTMAKILKRQKGETLFSNVSTGMKYGEVTQYDHAR